MQDKIIIHIEMANKYLKKCGNVIKIFGKESNKLRVYQQRN